MNTQGWFVPPLPLVPDASITVDSLDVHTWSNELNGSATLDGSGEYDGTVYSSTYYENSSPHYLEPLGNVTHNHFTGFGAHSIPNQSIFFTAETQSSSAQLTTTTTSGRLPFSASTSPRFSSPLQPAASRHQPFPHSYSPGQQISHAAPRPPPPPPPAAPPPSASQPSPPASTPATTATTAPLSSYSSSSPSIASPPTCSPAPTPKPSWSPHPPQEPSRSSRSPPPPPPGPTSSKPPMSERRRAQNRRAQQAHRDRRAQHQQALEARVAELQALERALREENGGLRWELLQVNNILAVERARKQRDYEERRVRRDEEVVTVVGGSGGGGGGAAGGGGEEEESGWGWKGVVEVWDRVLRHPVVESGGVSVADVVEELRCGKGAEGRSLLVDERRIDEVVEKCRRRGGLC